MPSWADLLGPGTVAEQLLVWGVLNQLLQDLLGPFGELIAQKVNAANPVLVPTPELLATMVVRGWLDQPTGETLAAKSGIDAPTFDLMVNNDRNPISPEEAAVALRRKIIPFDAAAALPSFMNAIRQGNLGDEWAPVVQALATAIPTPADILDAALEGQIPDGEDPVALYEQVGGDPSWYQLMFDTRGSAPTPLEAAEMANRRIIPWAGTGPGVVSFEQAFLEGPWRNKWLAPYQQLAVYVPPPRTVTTLIHDGAITDEQAAVWFEAQGMDQATAAAYVKSAHSTRTTAQTELTQANILKLYSDRLATETQAVAMLANIGVPEATAAYLLELVDFDVASGAYRSAVTRVGSLYTAHKITRQSALDALKSLDVPSEAQTALVAAWDQETASTVKDLTAAEITDLAAYGIDDQATCQALLEGIGYTPLDAWRMLSIKAKGPLDGRPAPGPGGGQATPVA